jgi:hypothetical protein
MNHTQRSISWAESYLELCDGKASRQLWRAIRLMSVAFVTLCCKNHHYEKSSRSLAYSDVEKVDLSTRTRFIPMNRILTCIFLELLCCLWDSLSSHQRHPEADGRLAWDKDNEEMKHVPNWKCSRQMPNGAFSTIKKATATLDSTLDSSIDVVRNHSLSLLHRPLSCPSQTNILQSSTQHNNG